MSIKLYDEIPLESWRHFIIKLMRCKEYPQLLKHCVWRGQRREVGQKDEDRELRASYFRGQGQEYFKPQAATGDRHKQTYSFDKNKFNECTGDVLSFPDKLLNHYNSFFNSQNLLGRRVIKDDQVTHAECIWTEKLIASLDEEYYKYNVSMLDFSWFYKYNLRDWIWAQHYGVKTPLLDWTKFPFYALFFAYLEGDRVTMNREIFALDTIELEKLNWELRRCNLLQTQLDELYDAMLPYKPDDRGYVYRSFESKGKNKNPNFIFSDMCLTKLVFEDVNAVGENARLIRQGGLFTYTPSGMSIEEWLRKLVNLSFFEELIKGIQSSSGKLSTILYRFIIPEVPDNREACLIYLNSMNVNDAMIYPDFKGLADVVNTADELKSKCRSTVRLY